MAEIKSISTVIITTKIRLELTEGEARALEAICGYGADLFVEWFYKTHGKHYLKPHEDAMRSLFSTVRSELPTQLARIDTLKKAIKDNR